MTKQGTINNTKTAAINSTKTIFGTLHFVAQSIADGIANTEGAILSTMTNNTRVEHANSRRMSTHISQEVTKIKADQAAQYTAAKAKQSVEFTKEKYNDIMDKLRNKKPGHSDLGMIMLVSNS